MDGRERGSFGETRFTWPFQSLSFIVYSVILYENLHRQQTDPSFDPVEEEAEDDPDEDRDPKEDDEDEQDPIGVPPRDTHSFAS